MSTKIETIVLEQFIQLGDKVRVYIDDESRAYGHPQLAFEFDGKIGEVVGFAQNESIHDRSYSGKTGVYSKRGLPLVRFEDGTGDFFGAANLSFVDEDLKTSRQDARTARGGHETDEQYSNTTWLRPLPETPFWEGDIVQVVSERWGGNFGAACKGCPTSAILKVDRIDYYSALKDPEKLYYNVSGKYASGHGTGQVSVKAPELILVERGNMWKYHHGEPLMFIDLQDEIRLHMNTHRVHEVKNPKYDLYRWSLKEAVTAVREGTVDGFCVSNGFFGSGPSIRVQRFEDRDLGERVRAKTIEGFSDADLDAEDEEDRAAFEAKDI